MDVLYTTDENKIWNLLIAYAVLLFFLEFVLNGRLPWLKVFLVLTAEISILVYSIRTGDWWPFVVMLLMPVPLYMVGIVFHTYRFSNLIARKDFVGGPEILEHIFRDRKLSLDEAYHLMNRIPAGARLSLTKDGRIRAVHVMGKTKFFFPRIRTEYY